MSKALLTGTWKLVRYTTIVDGTNEEIPLFDGNAIGYLIYTLEGMMSVHIMASNRCLPRSKEQEKIETAENYGGYCGRYEVKGSVVTHYPEISSVLSYIQAPQGREFKVIGNRLHLEYSHPLDEYTLIPEKTAMARSTVIWEKVQ